MADREKVISRLQIIRTWAAVGKDPIYNGIEPRCCEDIVTWIDDALALLKEQEKERERFINWLGRFCAHVDQQFQPLPDEQNIKFFREKMKQQFGWEVSGDDRTE